MAGMRNPAEVVRKWPSLAAAMVPIRRVLTLAIATNKELRGLPLAIGENPFKAPSLQAAIAWARGLVSRKLGLTRDQDQSLHAAGKWRHMIVGAVQRSCDCPDKELETWLGPKTGTNGHYFRNYSWLPLSTMPITGRSRSPRCKLLDEGESPIFLTLT